MSMCCAGLIGNDPRDSLPEATRFLQFKNFIPGVFTNRLPGSERLDSTSTVISKLRVSKMC
jgi:hypothetical protein